MLFFFIFNCVHRTLHAHMPTVWTVQCSGRRLDWAHPEESMASAGQTCAVQPAASCLCAQQTPIKAPQVPGKDLMNHIASKTGQK